MDDFLVLGLLIMGVVFGGFVLGIIGFFKAQRLERSIYEIKRQLSGLSVGSVLPSEARQVEIATPTTKI